MINNDIIRGSRENLVLVVKRTPFTVDGHRCLRWESKVCQLWDRATILHVGRIAPRSKDAANLHLGVSVSRGDKRSSGIIDQSTQLDGNSLLGVSQYHHLEQSVLPSVPTRPQT